MRRLGGDEVYARDEGTGDSARANAGDGKRRVWQSYMKKVQAKRRSTARAASRRYKTGRLRPMNLERTRQTTPYILAATVSSSRTWRRERPPYAGRGLDPMKMLINHYTNSTRSGRRSVSAIHRASSVISAKRRPSNPRRCTATVCDNRTSRLSASCPRRRTRTKIWCNTVWVLVRLNSRVRMWRVTVAVLTELGW